jgi:hypothetical protein
VLIGIRIAHQAEVTRGGGGRVRSD